MLDRIFVLMLENRSFDHMLGLSNISSWDRSRNAYRPIEGVDVTRDYNRLDPRNTTSRMFYVKQGGSDRLRPREKDPGHEFEHTLTDLCGPAATYTSGGRYPAISNNGFVYKYQQQGSSAPEKVMEVFNPAEVPNLFHLARAYTVCDQWYASMPGPTWPNRFFVHAGTSGGLDNSPEPFAVLVATLFDGYEFTNGTIYDRLDAHNIDWVIYEGDSFPQSFAIKGMTAQWKKGRFRDFKYFRADVSSPNFKPQYIFIEPDYGRIILPPGDFRGGNSQHPLDSVRSGDKLIGDIFEAISTSPHWNNSALVITYDEHGGFFDHVAPGPAPATGDDTRYSQIGFTFEQYGVRVPTVIISPMLEKPMVDGTVYDHTSILRTVERHFGLAHLTTRDEQAHDFLDLFSSEPSLLTPQPLPEMVRHEVSPLQDESAAPLVDEQANRELDPRTRGFLHVAFLRDLALREDPATRERAFTDVQTRNIQTLGEAELYLEEVEHRVRAFKTETQHAGQMDREELNL